MKKYSILFFVGLFNIGGVERVTVVLANEFNKRGIKVAIACCVIKDELLLGELDKDITVINFASGWLSDNNLKILSRYIHENNVNFVINQWCLPYKVTKFLRKAIGDSQAKLIAVHHNRPDINMKILNTKSSIIKSLIRFVTRLNLCLVYYFSDKYVVLCEDYINILKTFIKVKGEKIISIANPLTICINDKNPVKEDLIIYVGRLEETQKKVSRIFDFDYKWPLYIIGDGPDRNIYEEIANKKINSVIKFMGAQDPTEYYERAKILLLPSDFEGFPLVLCEAMAHGCVPVTLGTYAAAYEILANNGGVIAGSSYEKINFFKTVDSLINNPDQLTLLSKCAKKQSLNFSINAIVDKWEKLFLELC